MITSAECKPALPLPRLQRWQPLRLGLVNLYHYDSEEFWFVDGHLLFRGNNGTGKSKVLSLTLPFLFDAQLTSSRVEPDCDAGKKMTWNLLLGKLDRRMGYAWIEFGRLDDNGAPKYLTLGSGLSAVAARPQVDSWFFLVEADRVGQDLWLTSRQRVVLTKERLKERLEGHGQVFPTHEAYRRAVDERLFQLGSVRYAALMDTLIQLRQPQLSKKPDESRLSDALTEALPPLSSDLLADVAEAMNQLEEDRLQLEEYEKLAHAVAQFNTRYHVYASVHSRRQARLLRAAQTGFDNASRELNTARAALELARVAEQVATTRHQEAELALQTCRARLDELQSDPAMQDANRMENVARELASRRLDERNSERALAQAKIRLEREAATSKQRAEKGDKAEQNLIVARARQAALALAAGLNDSHAFDRLTEASVPQLAALEEMRLDATRDELRREAAKRREHVGLMRRRHANLTQAQQVHEHRRQTRDELRDELDDASMRRTQADAEVEVQGEKLVGDWQKHIDGLRQLHIMDASVPMTELAAWVLKPDGDNPAAATLLAAQQQTSLRLAEARVASKQAQQSLLDERHSLEAECEQLQSGEDAQPPRPVHRAADSRTGRIGAPLWKLVEFKDEVDGPQRAGLEAALEAAGLLDAWVAHDGMLQDWAGAPLNHQVLHDTELMPRPRVAASLRAWLRPADAHAAVPAAIVEQLLDGIACGSADDVDAETWVSTDGRFRLGALSGSWTKSDAAFIGFSARAAARGKRLEEIARRMTALVIASAGHSEELEQNRLDQEQAIWEWKQAPSETALHAAHAEARVRSQAFQTASERTSRAEVEYREALENLQGARKLLATDAADLHLPLSADELDAIEAAIREFNEVLPEFFSSTRELRGALIELHNQQEREKQARQDMEQRAQEFTERVQQASEAQARLDLLRDLIGAKVEELQKKLDEARNLVKSTEQSRESATKELIVSGQERVRCEEKAETLDVALMQATATRQHAIEKLQQFTATDLVAIALPDAQLPDRHAPWTIEPALNLARRIEQALHNVKDDDESWHRIQTLISQDFTELHRALGALHQQAQAETTDFGLIVWIVYQNRPERPDRLGARLADEIGQRRALLTAREREILENHLQAEIAASVQQLMQQADRQVIAINVELEKRPTSTGVRFRLKWLPLPEGAESAPIGLEAARKRLLNTSADLWSVEDRRVVGAMLQQRIAAERERADAAGGGSMLEQLAQALDYRRWHRFSVQRWQDGEWRKLSGPASSGERALGLTVPLFAAVASFYTQGGYPHAPRLVLLDEAFAGIDDDARAHCMGLIKEFDLDFVITSEREWACYAALPGVSICQLQRREGIDAVHVSRWTWNGRAKRAEPDPDRRFSAD